MTKKVNKQLLDLYNKYDGDLSLLFEPWANKKDRKLFTQEQHHILGTYIEHLEFLKVKNMTPELRDKIILKINCLEEFIDEEVIEILKKRTSDS